MTQPSAPAKTHPSPARTRSQTLLLCLTGFMGSGKTSVGKELAQQLSYEFLDLDRVIEARSKRSVAEIFAKQGEAGFRRAEREAVAHVLSAPRSSCVLAMGGGAFLQPEIAELIGQSAATTIFLAAPAEELYQRCVDSPGAGARPLLKDLSSFKKLYADRLPQYQRADWHVDTSGRSVREVAAEIAERVRDAAQDQ